ncbi:MAG: hypothetical protein J0H68_03635 [Sphingobacteriia bacterium]|nr:hypothetical protein [Sphingobacteriia bacterium]
MNKYSIQATHAFVPLDNENNEVNQIGSVYVITDQNDKRMFVAIRNSVDPRLEVVGDKREGFDDIKYTIESNYKNHMAVSNNGKLYSEYYFLDENFDDSNIYELFNEVNSQILDGSFLQEPKEMNIVCLVNSPQEYIFNNE